MTSVERTAMIRAMGMVELIELVGGPADGCIVRLHVGTFPFMRDDEYDMFECGIYRRRPGMDQWSAVVREPHEDGVVAEAVDRKVAEGAGAALFDWERY